MKQTQGTSTPNGKPTMKLIPENVVGYFDRNEGVIVLPGFFTKESI